MKKPQPKAKPTKARKDVSPWLVPVLLAVATLVAFSPCFDAAFTNWDEKRYLFETPFVTALTLENIRAMFSEKVLLSYNPLVVLSFAIDYSFVKTSPGWYHTVNVLLHIANGILLFLAIGKITGQRMVAAGVALLFALHPMHVESVAWVASRKDVLYTFFYFLSWWMYLVYLTSARRMAFYFLALFAFVLSLLSKSQAVTLPVLLLMSAVFVQKRWDKKELLKLIPFFVLSVAIGYFTLQGAAASADKYATSLTFGDKLVYSLMALGIYLYKAFLPMNQSAIYAFPIVSTQAYLVQIVLALALVAGSAWAAWHFRKQIPLVVFGIVFFYVHAFLILHILATNSSLVYERFTYVSYTGIFLAVTAVLAAIPSTSRRSTAGWVFGIVLVVFGAATYARCGVWQNAETLWSDVIQKNPASDAAFNNRGEYYYTRGELQKAYADYTASIGVNPRQPNPYNNRSVILMTEKRYAEALSDNSTALKLEPEFVAAYNNRGNIYFNTAQYDSAIRWFNEAVRREPSFASAWCNLGSSLLQKGQIPQALEKYEKAVALNPRYDEAYRYMGIAYIRMDSLDRALQYLRKADEINPGSNAMKVLSDEYLRLGSAAFKQNNADKALEYYAHAAEVNPSEAEAFYCIGGVWFARGDVNKARDFWKRTLQINPGHQEAKMWLGRIGN